MKKKQFDNRPKFDRLTDKEWLEATNSVKQLVKWRLGGSKTCSGAHSENVLGMPAVDYYVGEAIGKLANNEWEWQDRFTFAEQLRRVADNLISKRVEAWNRRPQEQAIVYMDLNILDEALAGTDDDEEGYDPEKLRMDRQFHIADTDEDGKEELYDRVFAIVEGDEELERFVEAIRICGELDDICDGLSITKQQAYNINKRLQRGLKRSSDKILEA